MHLKVIDPKDYERRGVPPTIIKAARVINELIAISPRAVTEALGCGDFGMTETSGEYKALVEHPFVIVGEVPTKTGPEYTPSGVATLSGLGILNGILMTPRFRLFATTEDDNYTLKSIGVFIDVDWDGGEA